MTRRAVVDRDLGWAKARAIMLRLPEVRVEAGVFGPPEVVTRALANEYGTAVIPERSFLRSTADTQRQKWAGLIAKACRRILKDGAYRIPLKAVGRVMAADIVATIDSRVPPPNAPSTVAKKGHDHSLIDTGQMRGAVTHRIVVVP